ncbi:MAG: mechanosensitive ion channel family protein [Dysgonamonadaceae bacterium]|jgi:small-conductance mechanosensitive channel|nr:mechanosensitive ion channel family protein [Dysgonamonadaceae bacterium]
MNINQFWDSIMHLLGIEPAHTDSYELVKHLFLFALVIILQSLFIWLTNYGYRRLKMRTSALKDRFLKPVFIRKYEFLSVDAQERVIFFLLNLLRWLAVIIQLLISIPVLFSIFPQTENIAMQLFSYILTPLKNIFWAIVRYIPNLFIIAIIWFIIHYVISGLAYISNEIDRGRLVIRGFYSDWAKPTYSIVRFLLYAFMLALIWPYLPHSDSGIFQGISIFIGVLVSFGSSSAIGNLIAGIIITYMRPFQIGDRIKINEVIGNVLEKTPVVTRIRTLKNEIITIPNSNIMNMQTTNLSESARSGGLIVHLTVTAGYATPWRQVHQLLIEAAQNTPDVMPEPQPFVLEVAFNEFDITYEINAYIADANKLIAVSSDLRQNIQDKFQQAKISILSPRFIQLRPSPGQ